MSTILTDDEIAEVFKSLLGYFMAPTFDDKKFARAVEAAVLAKLAQQEPVAFGMPDTQLGRKHRLMMVRLDKGQDGCTLPLYTHPAPPQADRQRVPDGWKLVPVEPTSEMLGAADREHAARGLVSIALISYQAMLTAAPEAPTQGEQAAEPVRDEREPSPTAGMTLGQRILHVGGRTNAAGYVEFGSVQAVDALVRHVLRDLPDAAPEAPAQASESDERDRKDAERYRWLREQMLGVDFDWDESGKTALCFEMPDGCSFAADCDQVIDDARAALAQKGGR